MKPIANLFICLIFGVCTAQIPKERLTDWHLAGNITEIKNGQSGVSIDSFGGKAKDGHNNDTAIWKAINYLKTMNGGTIHFNTGTYHFLNTITLSDSITLKGKGTSTVLQFNLKGKPQNCINIYGSISPSKIKFSNGYRGSDTPSLITSNLPPPGSVIKLFHNDSMLAFSSWAYGTIGQLALVKSIHPNSNKICLLTPLRLNFKTSASTYFRVLKPIYNVSVECLKISRLDSTLTQTNHISFNYAFNCRVKGVESENCNFGHIVFDNSIHNEVTQSYLHDAFAYGGNGQGYGAVMQSTSSDNKVENNIFKHLRHSVLVQSGANGNVIGYNYSREAYWSDNIFSNAAGDLVCHGNYAHHNLFEGNICQNIIVDNSHGKNGPYNTFYRNRAELYGLIVSNGQDSQNFIANEIVNSGTFMGQYIITGAGNLANKNNVKGTVQSNTNILLPDPSLYSVKKHAFLNSKSDWPLIGYPTGYNVNQNAASNRYKDSNQKTSCYNPAVTANSAILSITTPHPEIYPNPFSDIIRLKPGSVFDENTTVYNAAGKKMELIFNDGFTEIVTNKWPPGLYIFIMYGDFYQKLIKL